MILDRMPRADFVSTGGRYWLLDVKAAQRRYGIGENGDALVHQLLIHAPGLHADYNWYTIILIHLREQQAFRINRKCTHQLWGYTVAERSDFVGAATRAEFKSLMLMGPPDAQLQLEKVPSDAYAACVIERLAKEICRHGFNPNHPMEWSQQLACYRTFWGEVIKG